MMKQLDIFPFVLITSFSFLFSFCTASGDTNLLSRNFTKTEVCHMQDRIDNGCAEIQAGVFRLLDCIAMCRQNCLGVYRPGFNTCYLARQCASSLPNCNYDDQKVLYYVKKDPCQHNSVWDIDLDTCKCVDGWVGERCHRLPKHCGELRVYGYQTGWEFGKTRVYLDLDTYPTPINVRCDVFDTFENTMLMASFGDKSFDKTYAEYLDGFFYDEDNFWVGLEKMKALNEAGLKTLFLNAAFMDETVEYNLFQRGFYGFELNDASAGFTFTFTNSSTAGFGPKYSSLSYGDCLGPLQGGKFSTPDNDNDQVSNRNCAAEAGVGWWFTDCDMVCNPLGWNYNKKPWPEEMYHLKMVGIDYESKVYAKSSEVLMFFHNCESDCV